MTDRERVIKDNAIRGLQSAIEISGALVHLRKEHAKAILKLLKEQENEIENLKEIIMKADCTLEIVKEKLNELLYEDFRRG